MLFEEYSNRDLSFKSIIGQAPPDLVEYIETLKGINQSSKWHPEGDVYIHTKTVVDRLAKFNDINLTLAGLFHDTGKDRTTYINPKNNEPKAPNHEKYSAETVRVWSDWIRNMGADPGLVEQIVRWHMYIKNMDEIKLKHKEIMLNSPLYKDYLLKFGTADRGGTDI
jgi:poly(A) polymerase